MTKAHVQYSPLRRQEDFREMQQDISQTQVRYKECCLGLPSGFSLVRLTLCSSTAVAANTESIVGYYAFSFQFSGELKGSSTWPSMASHQQRLRCCLSWSTARAGMLRSIQVPTRAPSRQFFPQKFWVKSESTPVFLSKNLSMERKIATNLNSRQKYAFRTNIEFSRKCIYLQLKPI